MRLADACAWFGWEFYQTAGNLLKSKPSVVAVGDLAVLPWA
jgi:hypothetical protein